MMIRYLRPSQQSRSSQSLPPKTTKMRHRLKVLAVAKSN